MEVYWRAGQNDLAGRIRPAGRSLETPELNCGAIERQILHKISSKLALDYRSGEKSNATNKSNLAFSEKVFDMLTTDNLFLKKLCPSLEISHRTLLCERGFLSKYILKTVFFVSKKVGVIERMLKC